MDSLSPAPALTAVVAMLAAATVVMAAAPAAHADNRRLNQSVISNIFTAQRRNDCPTHLSLDERLVEAAHRHTLDLLASIELDGDLGSDGSTPQMRAEQAGFNAKASETVAITPALAISGMEILNQWWNDPVARQTMQNCSNSAVGVWSENSVARTVVVAVYGQPGS